MLHGPSSFVLLSKTPSSCSHSVPFSRGCQKQWPGKLSIFLEDECQLSGEHPKILIGVASWAHASQESQASLSQHWCCMGAV